MDMMYRGTFLYILAPVLKLDNAKKFMNYPYEKQRVI